MPHFPLPRASVLAAISDGDMLTKARPAKGETQGWKERMKNRLSVDGPLEPSIGDDEMARILREMGLDPSALDSMKPAERIYLRQCMDEMLQSGTSSTAKSLVDADFKRVPVSMEVFLTDKYYFGDYTKELFPKCHDVLVSVFDRGKENEPVEVLLGGALGWGKTTLAAMGMAYDIYRMTCMRDPHGYYGLMPGAKIVFAVYSVSKEQAADSAFAKIVSWIEGCPYFKEHAPRVGNHTTRANFKGTPLLLITGCVAAGTLVQTAAGAVPIEQMEARCPVVLTKVAGGLGTAWCSYARVAASGRKQCVAITTVGGHTLRCSLDHKVLVYDRAAGTYSYRRARDIVPGDTVLSLSRAPSIADARVLPDVPRRAAGGDISAGEAETGRWVEELLDAAVLGLRERRAEGQNRRGPDTAGRCECSLVCPEQGDGSRTLEALLRGARGGAEGEEVVASGTFTASREPARLAFGKPRDERGGVPAVDEEVPREGAAAGAAVRQVPAGPDNAAGGGAPSTGPETGVTGDAYFYGHRTRDGVVWRSVRLLWGRSICTAERHLGPCGAVGEGRGDLGGEHRSGVPVVQQQQARHAPGDVAEVAAGPAGGWGHRADAELLPDPVASVVDIGECDTYDVVQVNSPNHSVVTDGIVSSNSQEIHSIGKDMFAFLLDEANFLTSKSGEDDQSRAYAIYTNAKDRLRSRFMDEDGEIPGKVWLISSKRTHASFLEGHIKASKDDISAGRTHLYEYSQWAVRDPARFRKPKFRVEVGDRMHPSRILAAGEEPRVGAEVIIVPGEYRQSFEQDMDGALRNMAGIATESLYPLFRDRSLLARCVSAEMTHPFTRAEITTDITDDIGIETYFRPELLFRLHMSRYVPRFEPDAPRFVHVDVGFTQDAMGIACVHQRGWKEVRRVRNDGTYYVDKAPMIVADFVLRIVPPKGSEIDLGKMRAFLISLRDMGLPIHRVTLDGHQGRDTMQVLRKIDFDAVLYSVDKTDDAYMGLRQAVVEERIAYYEYETLMRELGELERDAEEGIVNHPKKSPSTGLPGSKDVSDALAGAVYNCLIDTRAAVGGVDRGRPADTVAAARTPGGALPWDQLDREARS